MSRNYLLCIGGPLDGRIVQPPCETYVSDRGNYVRHDFATAWGDGIAIASFLMPASMDESAAVDVFWRDHRVEWEPVQVAA